jgi:hypothetical protein
MIILSTKHYLFEDKLTRQPTLLIYQFNFTVVATTA